MIAALRLDSEGMVLAANQAAVDLLGSCIGRRCCDVVVGRRARMMHCTTTCAAQLIEGRKASSEHHGIVIRGQTCSLVCARVGKTAVVLITTGVEELGPVVSLSPRETEALSAVAHGLGTHEVAERLGVKDTTARTHIERAREKLGASNRAHAVALAIRRRLISPG